MPFLFNETIQLVTPPQQPRFKPSHTESTQSKHPREGTLLNESMVLTPVASSKKTPRFQPIFSGNDQHNHFRSATILNESMVLTPVAQPKFKGSTKKIPKHTSQKLQNTGS
jgi:hypothetical protein